MSGALELALLLLQIGFVCATELYNKSTKRVYCCRCYRVYHCDDLHPSTIPLVTTVHYYRAEPQRIK